MSVYVIAEAGSNHCGEMRIADALTRAAAEAGANAIKWQLFSASDLYAEGTEQHAAAKRAAMSATWVAQLAGVAHGYGLDFGCTAFARWGVDVVDPFVRWHKVSSLELTDVELVKHIARKRKPVLLSTGAATIDEVVVVRSLIEQSWWGVRVCVLQCQAAYPAPDDEVDLLAGPTMGNPWGYSDHTLGIEAAVGAAWLGAAVIEKHLRLDDTPQDSPDYGHSITPSEFAEMVRRIRYAEKARGIPIKYVRPSERELRKWQHAPGGLRGGIHAA